MSAASRLTLIAACGVATLAVFVSWQGIGVADIRHFGTPRNSLAESYGDATIPLPQGSAQRLVPAVSPSTSGGAYDFLFNDSDVGGQTRYDPCRPIGWVLSPRGMPSGSLPLLQESVDLVSAATGMTFVYEGTTDEVADFDRDLIQPRYGDRFAPVVVGWSTEDATPTLAGTVTGVGGSSSANGAYGDQRYLRAGVIILDSADLSDVMGTLHGDSVARSIMMHEWGHVVGLAHVGDPDELMNALNSEVTDWGPGDLEGLAIAGSGPCEDV